jgi:hypothetical protein
VWVLWVLTGLSVCFAVAVAVVVGRGARLADQGFRSTLPAGTLTTADLPAALRAG